MNNQISKLTYLLTFNVNIYAEIDNPKTSGSYIIDHNRQPTIHHKIGDTLEISEEAFMKFIEYGAMSNQTTTKFTEEKCITRFKTEDVDSVSKKEVWMQVSNYINTIDDSIGIKAWAESRRAAYLVDEFNGDNHASDRFNRNKEENIINNKK